MAARYFTLEEVLERVVNDEEVSDFDDQSEEDLPDVSKEQKRKSKRDKKTKLTKTDGSIYSNEEEAGVLLEAGTRVPAPVYSEYSTRLHKNEVMSG